MKKIIYFFIVISTFICIFCISSAAVTIGEDLLNPASYAGDPEGTPVFVVLGRYETSSDLVVFKFAEYGELDDLSSTDGRQILFDTYSIFDNGFNWSFYLVTNNYDSEGQIRYHYDLNVDLSKYGFNYTDVDPNSTTQLYFYTENSYVGGMYYDIFDLADQFYYSGFPDYEYVYNDEEYSFPILAIFDFYLWDGTIPGAPEPEPPVTDIPLIPGNINSLLAKIFETPVDTLSQIFTATNTLYAFISVFVFFMFVRFILKPILGGGLFVGASDHVKAMRRDEIDSERYGYYKNAHEYYDKKNRGG